MPSFLGRVGRALWAGAHAVPFVGAGLTVAESFFSSDDDDDDDEED